MPERVLKKSFSTLKSQRSQRSVNIYVLIASIINYEEVKSGLKCDDCLIEYSREHYEILFKNKKLVYLEFQFPSTTYVSCLCHSCLFKNLKQLDDGDEFEIKILHDEKEYKCSFFSD